MTLQERINAAIDAGDREEREHLEALLIEERQRAAASGHDFSFGGGEDEDDFAAEDGEFLCGTCPNCGADAETPARADGVWECACGWRDNADYQAMEA